MITVNISSGEAYDRLSILKVKTEKIKDPTKFEKVSEQFADLWEDIQCHEVGSDREDTLSDSYAMLIDINTRLWEVEDDIRECEAKQDFSDKFVQLARKVYHLNDDRHKQKLKIDRLFNSELTEQKDYTKYEKSGDISKPI